MSLAAKLEAARPVVKPKFEQYVDSLPEADRAALIAAAKDPAWSVHALLRVLRDEGVAVGRDSLSTWCRNVSRG